MTPSELLNWALGVHGTLTIAAFAALQKYSDRTEMYTKCVNDADALLARQGAKVADALGDELGPVIERAGGSPRLILPNYSEVPSNPVGSDAYKEAIRTFADHGGSIDLVNFGRTLRAKRAWCRAARRIGWVVLGLVCWELLALALLTFFGKVQDTEIPSWVCTWSFAPTVLLVSAFVACFVCLLRNHDTIQDGKASMP